MPRAADLIDISEKDGRVLLTVRVVPRASRSELAGGMEGALKVRIASPPVEGAANAELIKLFAKTFGISKSDIEITAGLASKTKQIRLSGITADAVRSIISKYLA